MTVNNQTNWNNYTMYTRLKAIEHIQNYRHNELLFSKVLRQFHIAWGQSYSAAMNRAEITVLKQLRGVQLCTFSQRFQRLNRDSRVGLLAFLHHQFPHQSATNPNEVKLSFEFKIVGHTFGTALGGSCF